MRNERTIAKQKDYPHQLPIYIWSCLQHFVRVLNYNTVDNVGTDIFPTDVLGPSRRLVDLRSVGVENLQLSSTTD